jgi:hypothetical protein
MPSPFPGMDPYLEGPQWTGIHAALSVEIARQLTGLLPERYVARPSERIVIATPDTDGVTVTTTSIYPDAFVSDMGAPASADAAGSVAVMTSPLSVATVMPEHIPQVTVEITAVENRRLVTAIEVLSPTNKRGDGREEYLSKRRRTLLSDVHLVEIDLLRGGQRVPMRDPLPPFPYFVFVGRASKRPMMNVWTIQLKETLPSIPIPLLEGDADVPLDLQQALTSVYETFRYDRTVDYARPLRVPLQASEAAWAQERIDAWRVLRAHGQAK